MNATTKKRVNSKYIVKLTIGLIIVFVLGNAALVMTDAFDPPALIAATFGNTAVAQIIFAYVCCQLIISTWISRIHF